MRVLLRKRLGLPGLQNVEVDVSFDHGGGAFDPEAVLAAVAEGLTDPDAEAPASEPQDADPVSVPKEEGRQEMVRMVDPQANGASVVRLMGQEWRPPSDLHGKQVRTVHRMVKAVDELTRDGRGATAQEISDHGRIALPTVYNALREDSPAADYVARLFLSTKMGRSRVVDLTQEGRYLASLIRANKVPA